MAFKHTPTSHEHFGNLVLLLKNGYYSYGDQIYRPDHGKLFGYRCTVNYRSQLINSHIHFRGETIAKKPFIAHQDFYNKLKKELQLKLLITNY